jgi:hypothetical protein
MASSEYALGLEMVGATLRIRAAGHAYVQNSAATSVNSPPTSRPTPDPRNIRPAALAI